MDQSERRAPAASVPFEASLRPEPSKPAAGAEDSDRRGYERRRTDRLRNETLDHLVQGLAHDLNNVLGVVLAQIDRLERSRPGADGAPGVIESLYAAVEHGTALSEAISMLSREHVLERDVVDVDALIRANTDLIRSAVPATIAVDFESRAASARVEVLRGSLERVLLNATLNAVRAMPAGGSLVITTRNERAADPDRTIVAIDVADDGIGIDDNTRRRAFDPAFTTRRVTRGHGFGLTAARQLVSATGGSIELSGRPGEGSVLTVRFPVHDGAHRPERRQADRPTVRDERRNRTRA